MLTKVLVKYHDKSKTRDKALKAISMFALENKLIENDDTCKKLYLEFLNREKISTTAFENGFAIPHAKMKEIKKPAIVIFKYDNEIDWSSMDGKGTDISIALLIPEDKSSTLHLDILSSFATLLMNKEFRDQFRSIDDAKELENFIVEKLDQKPTLQQELKNKTKIGCKKIVCVSACATGVVHTYMAKEALEEAGKKLGWNVRCETQGQKGQEFTLTPKEIDDADAVVFATDIYVDPERFIGKKFIQVKTNDAIHNAEQVLNKSLDAEVKKDMVQSNSKLGAGEFKSSKVKVFMGHLLSGVSRMIPFIVFSGILWAIFNSILTANPSLENNEGFVIAKNITEIGFAVFIAMMGGFIAESIAGRAGFAVGFISTFAAANSSMYFWWNINGHIGIPQIGWFFGEEFVRNNGLGNVGLSLFAAIMMGFASGYVVKWVNTWKTHKLITPIMPIIFIPVVVTASIVFPFIFLLSGPLGFLMNGLVYGISEAGKISFLNFFIGCLLGAMIGFDMGGPVNKIAGTTATALITIDPRLMGSVAAAIPVAPIGCGLATLIGRKMFTEKERAEGISALGLGFFGISEGAIPFAVSRPKKVLICNLVGSAIAGGLAFLFFVGGYVGMWGGPITALVLGVKAPVSELAKFGTTIPAMFGGGSAGTEFLSILWFFVAITGGSLVHAFLFVFMMKIDVLKQKGEYDNKKSIFKHIKFNKNNNHI